MNRRILAIAAGAGLMAAVAVGGTAVASGSSPADDDGADVAITGEALTRASAAALAHVGGGEVTETEVGDEESLYEVEIALADGSQIDVQLDGSFAVVGTETDGAGSDD